MMTWFKPSFLSALLPRLTKKARFALILASAVAVAVVVSAVVRSWLLDGQNRDPLVVALVAPLSGPEAALGRAAQQGAELRAGLINAGGGLGGRPVELRAFDDRGDPALSRELARTVAGDPAVLAVIGHHPDALADAAGVYAERGVPLLAIQPGAMAEPNPWAFRVNFDAGFEIRFLANYVRNVIGEPTIAIIREDSPQAAVQAEQFDRIIQRFGTRLVAQWTFAPGAGDLTALAEEVKQRMPTGAVVVLGSPGDSARVVVALRDANLRNLIAGPSAMASNAFRAHLVALAGRQAPETYGHGLLVSSPILFDTANERAQGFYGQYVKRFQSVPDWAAAIADDALSLVADAVGHSLAALPAEAPAPGRQGGSRAFAEAVRDRLAARDRNETAFFGTVGPWTFDAKGLANLPVLMALYNGLNPVAALTQLQPIREVGVSNFLEEVQRGRALYVNDRFMYKTNVIYTGVQINEVRDLSTERNEATINATVWFRYRGNFDPADVIFANAVKPVELGKPYREERDETTTYVAYRIEGRFALDFLNVQQAFGSKVAGLSFRHRTLNRNNVMFVTDVLGMGLIDTSDFVEKLKAAAAPVQPAEPTALDRIRSVLEGESEGSALLEQLRANRVLASSPGWRLSRAWISQDVVSVSTEGDPNYVGFGRPAPDFSRVDFGLMAVPDSPAARDFIRHDHFIYIAIFAGVLALFARAMDRKDRGQFWRIQTLVMRILSWPLLLMAVGNVALDWAVASLPNSGVQMIVNLFDVLWWMVPAFLVSQTLERFVWTPLEVRTQRRIPAIIRRFASFIVFGLAFCGIIAFVMKQPITSLLAASGLIGMVIGLAIQANIANVFSGIVLNLERPFKIGDSVQFTDLVRGVVVDMTWRTVRVRNPAGYTVAMPNGKVSEATVINFSAVERVWLNLEYFADPAYEPEFMAEVLTRGIRSAEGVMESAAGVQPFVRYGGMRSGNGQWLARYNLIFWVKDYDATFTVPEKVWKSVYATLREAGLEPSPPDLLDALVQDGRDPGATRTAAATAAVLADT